MHQKYTCIYTPYTHIYTYKQPTPKTHTHTPTHPYINEHTRTPVGVVVEIHDSTVSEQSTDTLQKVCQDYYSKILKLESDKFDVEHEVARKDFEASVASINDSRFLFSRNNN